MAKQVSRSGTKSDRLHRDHSQRLRESESSGSDPKFFAVDARTILSLGRESIKDHTTAVLELVKNAYDAGATVVDVEIKSRDLKDGRSIRIADNGHGMTEADIDDKWLRIGFSDKRQHTHAGNRRRVGEKGVGRLSADRLGTELELRSQARNQPGSGLVVSWDAFDQPGKDINAIPITVLASPTFSIPLPTPYDADLERFGESPQPKRNSRSATGTELIVGGLRQTWTPDDIKELHRELSILLPPFSKVVDFQIRLTSDTHPQCNGVVSSPFYEVAEIEAHFRYRSHSAIRFQLTDKSTPRGAAEVWHKTTWDEFVHRSDSPNDHNDRAKQPSFGPVDVTLLFYPRLAKTVRDTDMSLAQLKDFLDAQAGIKVYRDNVRVMPYGDLTKAEGGDWLGLGDRKARSPAGPSRPDYRVAPNQLVGAVLLSRDDNPALIDSAGREGLIHDEQFAELTAFVFGCIARLEAHYHELFIKQQEAATTPVSPRTAVEHFGSELKELKKQLDAVQGELPKRAERTIARVQDKIEATVEQIVRLEKSMTELASQATIYRALASVGISAATFSHETDAALDQFLSSLFAARNMLEAEEVEVDEVLDELAKAISAAERISAWGKFALKRVRPDKRRRRLIDFGVTISDVVEELRPAFEASGISLTATCAGLEGRAFAMDIESIVINLLTNAYFFCKQSTRSRQVRVVSRAARRHSQPGLEISVADSGPGVASKLVERIWDPLFSTKVNAKGRPTGTGLGLSIVDDILSDLSGERDIGRDDDLKGALFTTWIPLT